MVQIPTDAFHALVTLSGESGATGASDWATRQGGALFIVTADVGD